MEGQEADRDWMELSALWALSFSSLILGYSRPLRPRGSLDLPHPQGILHLSDHTLTGKSQCFILTALAPMGSVVSEWVPQEDEDQDDAGGCQRRAGDVEQPSCFGIFHCPIQVIKELLVPNLEPKRG